MQQSLAEASDTLQASLPGTFVPGKHTLTYPALGGGAFPTCTSYKGPHGAPPRKRHLNPQQRRALQMLASNPFGTAEALMLPQGFTRRTLAGLVRAGLPTARREIVKAGD